MQHPDPDELMAFALGSPDDMSSEIAAHVGECVDCAGEVDTLRQTADLVLLSNYAELAPPPRPQVWAAIANELGLADAGADLGAAPAEQTIHPAPVAARAALPPVTPRPVSQLPSATSRRPRWVVPLAALVVGAALGAGVLAVVQRDPAESVAVEATAPLTPVAGGPLAASAQTLGQAELVADGARQQIHVDASNLPAIGGAYEVWLFGPDGRMVSLGSLADGNGTYVGDFNVPQGINTAQYRTVDVSDEPADGDPAHSGVSVVRGSFS